MKTTYCTVVLLLGAVAFSAGSIIVYDPYPIGTSPDGYTAGLALQNAANIGVNATEGAWTGNLEAPSGTNYTVSSTGLTYTNLQVTGGSIQSVPNGSNFRPFSATNMTSTVYYSFLVNFQDFDSSVILGLGDSSNNIISGIRVDPGAGSNGKLLIRSNSSQKDLSFDMLADQTYLIAGRWTPGTISDTTDIWINPLTGGAAPTITATLTAGKGAGVAKWYSFINATGGEISDFTFDEFRVGTTWESVTPIPEPSSLALILAAVAGTLFRRSRPRC